MNVVFFGTPKFSIPALQALNNNAGFNVQLVVTQPPKAAGRGGKKELPSPVFTYAKEQGLQTLTPPALSDKDVDGKINGQGADVYVVVAYGKMIPASIFSAPPHGTVNIHPSKLPELRGPSPIQAALLEGKDKTAVSLMVIDKEMDHGPIISQREVVIARGDTYSTLSQQLAAEGTHMLVQDLPSYVAGELQPKEQDHKKATFSKIITKEDGHIDWSQPAEYIYNQWRAFFEWPGVYVLNAGRRITLREIVVAGVSLNVANGTLVAQDGRLFVQCGTGVIEIVSVQPEGKKPIGAKDFINGYQHLLGTVLT